MNISEVQKRLDALVPLMLAKGMRKPEAEVDIRSQAEPDITLRHLKADAVHEYDRHCFFPKGTDLEAKFAAAVEWIEEQPGPEETKLRNFMAAVAKAIDLGKETGIEADFVNPLSVLMKTLSENALTYQRQAAE